MVVPQVVALESTAKCESEVEKGLVMLMLSVPMLVSVCSMTAEVLPTIDVAEVQRWIRVVELDDGVGGLRWDEEIAACRRARWLSGPVGAGAGRRWRRSHRG